MGMQENLTSKGFKKVTGMTETVGGGARPTTINKGTPETWDTNNGVTVVYDDNGDVWVYHGCLDITDLNRGAYVPFSNDGGYGIRQLFPNS